MFSTRRHMRERVERSSRAWRHVSGLLPKVSPLVGRFGDGDPGGRVTCRRWVIRKVAEVVSPVMEVFLAMFPKNLPFSEKIQALGSDTM